MLLYTCPLVHSGLRLLDAVATRASHLRQHSRTFELEPSSWTRVYLSALQLPILSVRHSDDRPPERVVAEAYDLRSKSRPLMRPRRKIYYFELQLFWLAPSSKARLLHGSSTCARSLSLSLSLLGVCWMHFSFGVSARPLDYFASLQHVSILS